MNISKKVIVAAIAASAAGLAVLPGLAQDQEAARGGRGEEQRGFREGGPGPRYGGPDMQQAHRMGDRGPHGQRMAVRRGPGFDVEAFVERYDENGDGTVSAVEIESVNAARLDTFDTDGDGSLSLVEFRALWTDAMQRPIVRSFQARDTDGDAVVTLEEYGAEADRLLSRLDRDGDGSIGPDELRGRGPDGERGPRGPGGPGGAEPAPEGPDGAPAGGD